MGERDWDFREPSWLDLQPVQQPGPYVGGFVCEGCGGRDRHGTPGFCTTEVCDTVLCDECINSQDGFHCQLEWLETAERLEQRLEDPGAPWRRPGRGGLD